MDFFEGQKTDRTKSVYVRASKLTSVCVARQRHAKRKSICIIGHDEYRS